MSGLIGFALALVLTFFSSLVVQLWWQWFVVPLGAPSITYWHAFGLSSVFTMISVTCTRDLNAPKGDDFNALLVFKLIVWAMVAGAGLVVHEWAFP